MDLHIGVAISGGGHRASRWGLGTLLYLADSGKHREVAAISSVSGGVDHQRCGGPRGRLPQHRPPHLRPHRHAPGPARGVAHTVLFFWGPATNAYVGSTPDVARRARDVIALLGDDTTARKDWETRATTSTDVPTVLRKLGTDATLDLLAHSYVLAMCNLHALHDYPLLPLPERERSPDS